MHASEKSGVVSVFRAPGLLGAGLILLAFQWVFLVNAGQAADGKRPNIILIMVDDLGYEGVSAYGSPTYKTPNLDALAAGGMLFNHCYSTPICTPSRVQIMTGQYNFRNYKRFGFLDPSQVTFANVLRDGGYQTAIAGKWQLGGDGKTVRAFGFDKYCLWHLNGRDSRYWNPRIEQDGRLREGLESRFGPDVMCDYVLDVIEKREDKPLFVYWPMVSPHWPFVPTPDSPADGSRERVGTYDGKSGGTEYFDDMVNYLDKIVGRLVAKLKSEGIRDNTLLLFTCDNGCATNIKSLMQGRVIKGGKASLPDAGTHVALLANWPAGIKAGQTSDALVDFTDVLPTLAELGRIPLPKSIKTDGRSFAPVLAGDVTGVRDWIFCHYIRNGVKPKPSDPKKVAMELGKQAAGKKAKTMGRFARSQKYKLYGDGRLYDISKDVLELKVLKPGHDNAEQRESRSRLQEVHDRMPPWQPFAEKKERKKP